MWQPVLKRKRKSDLYAIITHKNHIIGYTYDKRVAKRYAWQYSKAHEYAIVAGVEEESAYQINSRLLEEWEETYVPAEFYPAYVCYVDVDKVYAMIDYYKLRSIAYKKWKDCRPYYEGLVQWQNQLKDLKEVPPSIELLTSLKTMYDEYKSRLYY